MKLNKKAFTLIELIVVIGIIGLIVTLSIISLGSIRQNANDLKKVSDIKQIQAALELYRVNEGSYPASMTSGQPLTSASTTYMTMVPFYSNTNSSDDCSGTDYIYTKVGYSYTLDFCLNKSTANLSAGPKCATPQGILNQTCLPPFTCGENLTYEGESYPTVLIDSQCWFAKNLNVGTWIGTEDNNLSVNYPAGYDQIANTNDDCVDIGGDDWDWFSCQGYNGIQKYCYDNNQNNCTTHGGLYEWAEALGLPADCNKATSTDNGNNTYTVECTGNPTIQAKQQGICPIGWHIPTDNDWHTLELVYTDPNYPCDIDHSGNYCAPAGTELKTGGTSGFNGILAGYRSWVGSFFNNTNDTYFWTTVPYSSDPDYITAWVWSLDTTNVVLRYPVERTSGASVRCIKN